jgi:hypothetical protein
MSRIAVFMVYQVLMHPIYGRSGVVVATFECGLCFAGHGKAQGCPKGLANACA